MMSSTKRPIHSLDCITLLGWVSSLHRTLSFNFSKGKQSGIISKKKLDLHHRGVILIVDASAGLMCSINVVLSVLL